jgi:hypothetical protein
MMSVRKNSRLPVARCPTTNRAHSRRDAHAAEGALGLDRDASWRAVNGRHTPSLICPRIVSRTEDHSGDRRGGETNDRLAVVTAWWESQ